MRMNKCIIIGGCNIDIIGKCNNDLLRYDSNIGEVNITYGGVGRNIAENMTKLDIDIYFKTNFSNDSFGKLLYEKCLNDKFDLKYSKIINDARTSIYLAILDNNYDLDVGINDMDILKYMTKSEIKEAVDSFGEDDYVVFDTNLDVDLIDYILVNKHYKTCCDPISINKIHKIKDYIKYIDIFKPNLFEANALSNYDNNLKSIQFLVNEGCINPIITLNREGVLYYNKGKYIRKYITSKIEIINATGAGDSFFATYISYLIKGYSIDDSIDYALLASILTLSNESSVAPNLSSDKLEEIKKLYNIEKETLC